LAGLLLKLGTFGVLRYLIGFIPKGIKFYLPIIITIVLLGVIYTGFTTLRQIDIKKIIAYSSVGHMSYVILGLMTNTLSGIRGSVAMMYAHGIVSGGLFAAIGVIYERIHTRIINYCGGFSTLMPIYGALLLILVLSNLGLPGTVSFTGEISLIMGILITNLYVTFISSLGLFLCSVYSIKFFNLIMFGNFDLYSERHAPYFDDLVLEHENLSFLLEKKDEDLSEFN